MSTVAILIAAQMLQTLPPPTAAEQSPVDYKCEFLTHLGTRFGLSGRFPEFSAGWDVNRGKATTMNGNGPVGLQGAVEVKPFSANSHYRRYYVTARHPEGGHYNAMFALFADDTGVATIERFYPDLQQGGGAMKSVATGSCESVFHPATSGSGTK